MPQSNCVVAVYASHTVAEAAVKELERSGFDLKLLSIIGRDYRSEEHVVGYYSTGDRMKYWGTMGAGLGAFWGGLWGLLFGAAFFWVPGLGPTLVAGPLVSSIVGALEGGVLLAGFDAIGAGLYSLGVPKDSILKYETALKSDNFLLIAHGSAAETTRAQGILRQTNPDVVEQHQPEMASA
jgi:hypothetical protein